MTHSPAPDWHARARVLAPETRAFIGGQYVDAASGAHFDTVNPATGLATAQVAACGSGDADRAVTAAQNAFDAGHWAQASPAQRKAVLLRLADLIEGELSQFIDRSNRKVLANDDKLEDGIRRIVRQVAMEEIGKKPEVTVVISRLQEE